MDRRKVMVGLAAMFGAELIQPLRAAVAAELDPVDLTGASLFGADLRQDLAAVAETIIPTTDTPGARDAGVADFVEFMLQEWFPDEDRQRFEAGMAGLTAHCTSEFGARFAALSQDRQIDVIADLEAGRVRQLSEGGRDFFEQVKQLTVFGYYTSETGMTVERKYLPVPGRYDGAYPYEKVGTLFTS